MNARSKKRARVTDIARVLDQFAPPQLSEDWDNCGLQVGSRHWEVQKVWVALDPLRSVISEAGRCGIDMVITHHPLILRALRQIDLETTVGRIIADAVENRIAIYAAHTNLDSTIGGVNDVLSQKIGLRHLSPLKPIKWNDELLDLPIDAGRVGIGRIGELMEPLQVSEWVPTIKEKLGLPHVTVSGDQERIVNRVAVCSGSGGSLIPAFLDSDAQVFISGDLRYHDARAVEDAGRILIDIGHFASEQLILEPLATQLTAAIREAEWDVQITSCRIERDPFEII